MRAAVGKKYEKLHLAFDNFQNVLKTTYQQQKVSARPEKRATITYMFSKASTLQISQFAILVFKFFFKPCLLDNFYTHISIINEANVNYTVRFFNE